MIPEHKVTVSRDTNAALALFSSLDLLFLSAMLSGLMTPKSLVASPSCFDPLPAFGEGGQGGVGAVQLRVGSSSYR